MLRGWKYIIEIIVLVVVLLVAYVFVTELMESCRKIIRPIIENL